MIIIADDKYLKYEEFKKGLVGLTPEEYEEAVGRLFCSDECRIENLKEEMELEKERREGKTNGRKISQINQRE